MFRALNMLGGVQKAQGFRGGQIKSALAFMSAGLIVVGGGYAVGNMIMNHYAQMLASETEALQHRTAKYHRTVERNKELEQRQKEIQQRKYMRQLKKEQQRARRDRLRQLEAEQSASGA